MVPIKSTSHRAKNKPSHRTIDNKMMIMYGEVKKQTADSKLWQKGSSVGKASPVLFLIF